MDSSSPAGETSQLAALPTRTRSKVKLKTSNGPHVRRRAAIKATGPARVTTHTTAHRRRTGVQDSTQETRRDRDTLGESKIEGRRNQFVMEGLIPFVLDAIRRSNGRSGGYRSLSSDGGSSRGGGGSSSRRHLIDYMELSDTPAAAAAAANAGVVRPSGRRNEEYGRPAPPVVAGSSAYRRK